MAQTEPCRCFTPKRFRSMDHSNAVPGQRRTAQGSSRARCFTGVDDPSRPYDGCEQRRFSACGCDGKVHARAPRPGESMAHQPRDPFGDRKCSSSSSRHRGGDGPLGSRLRCGCSPAQRTGRRRCCRGGDGLPGSRLHWETTRSYGPSSWLGLWHRRKSRGGNGLCGSAAISTRRTEFALHDLPERIHFAGTVDGYLDVIADTLIRVFYIPGHDALAAKRRRGRPTDYLRRDLNDILSEGGFLQGEIADLIEEQVSSRQVSSRDERLRGRKRRAKAATKPKPARSASPRKSKRTRPSRPPR